jgi:hypothetical protein
MGVLLGEGLRFRSANGLHYRKHPFPARNPGTVPGPFRHFGHRAGRIGVDGKNFRFILEILLDSGRNPI